MSSYLASAFAAALIVIAGADALRAHEGHDHGAPAPSAPVSAQPRGEAHSEAFELVAIANGTKLVVYLDRFADNEPVDNATVEIETTKGPATATREGDGVYRLDAPWLADGGAFELIATVTAGDVVDILPFTLRVPAGTAAAATDAPAGGIASVGAYVASLVEFKTLLIAGAGFALGVVLMALGRRRRSGAAALLLAALAAIAMYAPAPAMAHEGHDHNDASPAIAAGERAQRQSDGAVFVPKPIQRIFGIRTLQVQNATIGRAIELPGRIIPDPNASGFVQTATSGRLSPPPGGFPRLGTPVKEGDVLAFVTPPMQAIDVSDMRQRQGELDQQITIVERRLARYETLAPSGAVARSVLEETKLELDGLRDRRAALDRVRSEPLPLIAPVSGVVAEGTPVAGQIAQTNSVVFHIVDPARLWIEALSFETVTAAGSASAKTGNGKTLALAFRGAGLADRSQSIPVHFAIEGEIDGLRAGQFVTVFAQTGERREGLAVPRSAVVRTANGQDFVFEHVTAERFEPRPVRVETLDAERVLISAGVEAGRRVVIQGAELLDHVR